MSSNDENVIKRATLFLYDFYEKNQNIFFFHNYALMTEKVKATREIAKSEEIKKKAYEMGLLAMMFKDAGLESTSDPEIQQDQVLQRFLDTVVLSIDEMSSLKYFLQFFKANQTPKNKIEQVLLDGNDIQICFPDIFERFNLLRLEHEKILQKVYSDQEWLLLCKSYYLQHQQFTAYARTEYGIQRRHNFDEIQKRLDKIEIANSRSKYTDTDISPSVMLSEKETEDFFKMAFRNYVALISVADRKAGLLIQVNSILCSIIIGFTIRHSEATPLLLIPTSIILLSALGTIFCAILSSRPHKQTLKTETRDNRPTFFFGSFDRIDPGFRYITLDEYEKTVKEIFLGDKKEIFRQIIRETFQVRKVLARKFGFLAIAYKIFITGLSISAAAFLIVSIIKDHIK